MCLGLAAWKCFLSPLAAFPGLVVVSSGRAALSFLAACRGRAALIESMVLGLGLGLVPGRAVG